MRRFGRGLVAVSIGLLAGVWAGSAWAAELAGELVRASGPVEVRPLGEAAWRPAALRAVLHPGDMVRTGPGGAAEVALVHGVFRMDENTVIILPPPRPIPAAAGGPTAVQVLLYRGRALFQLLQERLQGSFDVITPSVIVGVKGTTFGVEQRALAGVVVFDGSVQVVPAGRAGAAPVTVGAGQFTVLVQGGLSAPRPFQPGAPGAVWSGAPTTTESRALSAAPTPPVSPPGQGQGPSARSATPGSATPALAQAGGTPGIRAAGLTAAGTRVFPPVPRLASVGGPRGSSGGPAASGGPAGQASPGGGPGSVHGGSQGGGKGNDKEKGGCKGKGKGKGAAC